MTESAGVQSSAVCALHSARRKVQAVQPPIRGCARARDLDESTAQHSPATLHNCMGEQSGVKRVKPQPPSRLGKPATSGSFQKGDPRINRNGRPRAGTAFSERGRERLDPDKVLDLVETTLNDESIPARERLAIVMPVIDRIYVKPPQTHDVAFSATVTPRSLDHLSEAEVRARLSWLRGQPLELPEASESDADTSVVPEVES